MIDESIILLGEKVELINEDDQAYKTKVEDVTKTGLFLVAVPSLGGMPLHLYVGDTIDLGFYRESGRYVVQMEAVAFEKIGEVYYVWLLQRGVPHRQQRRDAYRLPVSLKVEVFKYEDGIESHLPVLGADSEQEIIDKVNTRDISIGGVAIATKHEYGSGELYLLEVFLDDANKNQQPLPVCAEVVRASESHDDKVSNVGLRFHELTNNKSEILSKYVFNQQQILIKQRRPASRR